MILILEIVLTIIAWRKGYKGYALLPLGIVFLIAFMVGFSTPELSESADLSFIVLDLMAIVALVIMVATAKKPDAFEIEEQVEYVEPEESPVYEAGHLSITEGQFESVSSSK